MTDTTNRGSLLMDKKKNDMPIQDDNAQTKQDIHDSGQKGGMSKRDQNSSHDGDDDLEMTEEFEEIDIE
jgi:hypothetical protein